MNRDATSGGKIIANGDSAIENGANRVGGKETESIFIDLRSLTESDLRIHANNNYEVTDEGSGCVGSKMKDDQEMQNFATEMVLNVLGGANEQISEDNAKLKESESPETVNMRQGATSAETSKDGNPNTVTQSRLLDQRPKEAPSDELSAVDEAVAVQDLQPQLSVPDRVDTDDSKQSWEVISDSLLVENVTQVTSISSSTLNVSLDVPGVTLALNEYSQIEDKESDSGNNNMTQQGSREQTTEDQETETPLREIEKLPDDQLLEGDTEQGVLEGKKPAVSAEITDSSLEGSTEQVQINAADECQQPVESEQFTRDGDKDEKSKQNEAEDEWLDILGNGLLQKKVIQAGDGVTSRPVREQEIVIKYAAKLEDSDEIVDFNENLSLVLGEQESIDLFDIVCALMQKGETSRIVCDAKYAYGEEGKPPRIPPKATMEFEIELLQVDDGPYSAEYKLEKRLDWAGKKRCQGNDLFSTHKYLEAAMVYMKAIKALEKGWLNEESDAARSQINELRFRCYNNVTVAHMKLLKWSDAFKTCRAAEKLNPKNVRMLFRKGKILCELSELQNGISYLKKALDIEPRNKTISSELAKQNRKLEKQTATHQRMCQKMFGNIAVIKNSERKDADKSWFTNNLGRLIGGTFAVGVILVGIYAAHKM